MSLDAITPEDTIKIAGILDTKVTQAYEDLARFKAEAASLRVSLDAMTVERDYWRNRSEETERDRDEYGEAEEFMARQWETVLATAKETMARRAERRRTQDNRLAGTQPAALSSEKMPSVVVFNRG